MNRNRNLFKIIILTVVLLLAPQFRQANSLEGETSSSAEEWEAIGNGSLSYPNLPVLGRKVKDFLPPGWEIIAQPSGDLNGDKILDYALVLEDNDPPRWKTDDEQAEEPYMYASRILAILFGGTRGGYSLAEQSNTFIMERCDPYMEEPFTGIEISNEGDLQISFNLFYTAGSWYTTSGSYTFRYINKEFTLISVKRFDYKRNTGESWDYSYDFLAMTRTMVEESPEESEEEPVVIEETIELDEPITLKSLEAPFSLQIGDWDPI